MTSSTLLVRSVPRPVFVPAIPPYAHPTLFSPSQDEYTLLNSKHAIGIHGFVLVYSVTSKKSFDMVQVVYDKIIDYCGLKQIPCVIVGSKTDLPKRYATPPAPPWRVLSLRPSVQLTIIARKLGRYP